MPANNDDVVQIATLSTQVGSLTEAVKTLNSSMQENNKRLERLAVLEAMHTHSSSAIERAFGAIAKLEKADEEREAENERDHKTYNRAIWTMVGFCFATSIFWTVFGVSVKNTMDDLVKTSFAAGLHIRRDQIMSPQDVQSSVDGMSGMSGMSGGNGTSGGSRK